MRNSVSALLIAAALGISGAANAATATATFNVTATVQKNCQVSASALAFGAYTPGGGNVDGSSAITVNCTKNTAYTVALNSGSTTGGTFAQRLLSDGTNTLQYNLYTTTGRTTVFGDSTAGTQTVGGTGAGFASAQTVTVYGRIPDSTTNQNAAPSGLTYSDTVTVTLTY